ncbi:MAG: peptidase M6 [Gemmatimonadetes bacterium]|nr:peptidase M6 [Gemmatimonadota bacterium]
MSAVSRVAAWSAAPRGRKSRVVSPLALLAIGAGSLVSGQPAAIQTPPLDPQQVQDQDDMTWDDYHPIPGRDWADPSLVPQRGFRIALIAIDFPDQPFVITQPRRSDPFGNPQIEPVPREAVPQFYADFFLKPSTLNHGETINGYWMEQSRGRFGITEIDAYGPYRMPRPLWAYGLSEYGQNEFTPDGSRANNRMEPDVDSLWRAGHGDLRDRYDAILRIYAGYDETSVWQEFGEMKFDTREDIPPEWGNPDSSKPRWVPTRYVPWTSWLAGAQQWGLSSMRQGESSGTITHELGHFAFRIPDLNNNPYVTPYRRAAAGPWDMMDRGSFNGPGGPHMRWVVPPTNGAAMPAGLMLRNRLANGFLDTAQVLRLSRDGLARSGLIVARVTARAVEPLPGTFAGLIVRFDGDEPHDRTPPTDPASTPLSPGTPNYDFYTVEVVQRIGYDSFTPDNGVLIAMNKDSVRGNNGGPNAFNSFIWVIDAHPEDIGRVDYVRPNGEPVVRTIADYRQLNDALFHAGLDSGSEYEFIDVHNRLHFYVIDLHRDERGIRSYTLAVRSLDGAGAQSRAVALDAPAGTAVGTPDAPIRFTLRNTGTAAVTDAALHPQPVAEHVAADVYRLSVTIAGEGWSARLVNELAAARFGESAPVVVHVARGSARTATLTLTAASESDISKRAAASITLSR